MWIVWMYGCTFGRMKECGVERGGKKKRNNDRNLRRKERSKQKEGQCSTAALHFPSGVRTDAGLSARRWEEKHPLLFSGDQMQQWCLSGEEKWLTSPPHKHTQTARSVQVDSQDVRGRRVTHGGHFGACRVCFEAAGVETLNTLLQFLSHVLFIRGYRALFLPLLSPDRCHFIILHVNMFWDLKRGINMFQNMGMPPDSLAYY